MQMNEQESLQLIQQMIFVAKQEQKDDGTEWIIWGWTLFATSMLTFINLKTQWVSQYFFWDCFGIASICFFLVDIVRSFFIKTNNRIKTYPGELFKKLNLGFFICLVFGITGINKGIGPMAGFPVLVCFYGFWILIYGTILNFKPSIIGAFVTWIFAFIGLFAASFEIVMLTHAAAVLFGYIVPGHIANAQFKKIKRQLNPGNHSV